MTQIAVQSVGSLNYQDTVDPLDDARSPEIEVETKLANTRNLGLRHSPVPPPSSAPTQSLVVRTAYLYIAAGNDGSILSLQRSASVPYEYQTTVTEYMCIRSMLCR